MQRRGMVSVNKLIIIVASGVFGFIALAMVQQVWWTSSISEHRIEVVAHDPSTRQSPPVIIDTPKPSPALVENPARVNPPRTGPAVPTLSAVLPSRPLVLPTVKSAVPEVPPLGGGMTTAPRVGQRVEAQHENSWLPAEVVRVTVDSACVRFDSRPQLEWMAFDHLREIAVAAAPVIPAASAPAPQPLLIAPVAPGISVDEAIVMLEALSATERVKGCEALAGMTPDKERRAGVLNKLSEVYRDTYAQSAAARSLAVWGDEAMEKLFIDRLLTGRKEEHPGIFEMLAQRNTKTATQALVRRLRVADDMTAVEIQLPKMGEKAEPAVREMLTDQNRKVRRCAADILRDIGTAESLPAMQKLAQDTDVVVASSARLAIDAIKGRIE